MCPRRPRLHFLNYKPGNEENEEEWNEHDNEESQDDEDGWSVHILNYRPGNEEGQASSFFVFYRYEEWNSGPSDDDSTTSAEASMTAEEFEEFANYLGLRLNTLVTGIMIIDYSAGV